MSYADKTDSARDFIPPGVSPAGGITSNALQGVRERTDSYTDWSLCVWELPFSVISEKLTYFQHINTRTQLGRKVSQGRWKQSKAALATWELDVGKRESGKGDLARAPISSRFFP